MSWQVLEKYIFSRISRNIIYWLFLALLFYKGEIFSLKLYSLRLTALFFSFSIPCYINNLILIPNYLLKRKFLMYWAMVLVLIFIVTPIPFYITQWLHINYPELNYMETYVNRNIISHSIPCFFFMALLATGKFASDIFYNQRKLELLERKQLFSELESLKSQVNPHFLFNALNTIYGLVKKDNKETAEVVRKLSDIMRYVLLDANASIVSLESEVNLIQDYLEFTKLRSNAKIDFKKTGDFNVYEVAPLLLLPLIENAIKNSLEKHIKNPWMAIEIKLDSNILIFQCAHNNLTNKNQDISINYIHELGLENLKRRLDLLYGSKYQLDFFNNEKEFIASLKLELK